MPFAVQLVSMKPCSEKLNCNFYETGKMSSKSKGPYLRDSVPNFPVLLITLCSCHIQNGGHIYTASSFHSFGNYIINPFTSMTQALGAQFKSR
jgi:hypothetical protein